MPKPVNYSSQLIKVLLILGLISIQLVELKSQSNLEKHREDYFGGRTHITEGWVHAIHFSTKSPLGYTGYQMLHPNIGLGAGLAYQFSGKIYTSRQPHHESDNMKGQFIKTFIYGKILAPKARWRVYLDGKIGYGKALPLTIFTDRWEEYGYGRFTSGLLYEPGIGLDFSTRYFLKWGLKISRHFQETSIVRGAVVSLADKEYKDQYESNRYKNKYYLVSLYLYF